MPCIDTNKCTRGTFATGQVCKVDTLESGCPPVTCAGTLVLDGAVCNKYDLDGEGRCDGTGKCHIDCATAVGNAGAMQSKTVVASCASAECVKPDVCDGQDTGALTTDTLCFSDFNSGNCLAGRTCGAGGACVPVCTVDDSASTCGAPDLCFVPAVGNGRCCNVPCNGECEECSTGTCQPKAGECAATAPCTTLVKGWSAAAVVGSGGRVCERYDQDPNLVCVAGECNTLALAADDTTVCQDTLTTAPVLEVCGNAKCELAAGCAPFAAVSSVTQAALCAVDAQAEACDDIACDTLVAGWVSVESHLTCLRYDAPHTGYCDAQSECSTSTDRCDLDAVPATTTVFKCPSQECIRADRCLPLSPVTSNDAADEVCHLSADEARCPRAHSFDCKQFVTGWSGTNCQRYDRDIANGAGHCDGTGACIDECSEVPNVQKVNLYTCGSIGCVRKDKCQVGDDSSTLTSLGDVCYVGGETSKDFAGNPGPTDCPAGATCDESGSCVFADDGIACNDNSECGSGFCVKNEQGAGTCCNEACTLECQICVRGEGTCKSRIGDVCDTDNPIECGDFIKGFGSAANANQCLKYTGTTSAKCIADGSCDRSETLCGNKGSETSFACKSEECRRSDKCNQFDATTDNDALDEVCIVDTPEQDCDNIDCTLFLAGMDDDDGTTCLRYSTPHSGYCDAEAGCATNKERCTDDQIVSVEPHVSCGSPQCVQNATVCTQFDLAANVTLPDLCRLNETELACPPVECGQFVRGWEGRRCTAYVFDLPGSCDGLGSCREDGALCSDEQGAVTLERCGDEACRGDCVTGTHLRGAFRSICLRDAPSEACDDFDCRELVSGWEDGRCHQYVNSTAGYCDATSRCASGVESCALADTLPIDANATACSEACQRPGACVRGSPLSFADTFDKVCLLDATSDACAPLNCTTQLSGWQNGTCTRFALDLDVGFCDGSGECVDACDAVPLQTVTEHVTCDEGCVRSDTCVAGTSVDGNVTISDFCFTSEQQGCADGAVCNLLGRCEFEGAVDNSTLADGGECGNDDAKCASGHCVDGVCCNSACEGECRSCADGFCAVLVDEPCGDGVCRACGVSGECEARSTPCGLGAFNCTGDAAACAEGTCGECAAAPPTPPVFVPPAEPELPVPDCIDDSDCSEQGTCRVGRCECDEGFAGRFCDHFDCPDADNCNSAYDGGVCVGGGECQCNEGFVGATCLGNCTALNDCNGHGRCVYANLCVCEAAVRR